MRPVNVWQSHERFARGPSLISLAPKGRFMPLLRVYHPKEKLTLYLKWKLAKSAGGKGELISLVAEARGPSSPVCLTEDTSAGAARARGSWQKRIGRSKLLNSLILSECFRSHLDASVASRMLMPGKPQLTRVLGTDVMIKREYRSDFMPGNPRSRDSFAISPQGPRH